MIIGLIHTYMCYVIFMCKYIHYFYTQTLTHTYVCVSVCVFVCTHMHTVHWGGKRFNKWLLEGVLISNVCQSPWDKYSQHGHIQATPHVTIEHRVRKRCTQSAIMSFYTAA